MIHPAKVCAFAYVAWLLSACFPAANETADAARSELLDMHVLDAEGGRWPLDAMPRMPAIVLTLAGDARALSGSVWLVRDAPAPELLEDLARPPLRRATEAQVIPITRDTNGNMLTIAPRSPLEPGAALTLLGLHGDEPVFERTLYVSRAAGAGARFVASLPPHGASAVPPNLDTVLVQLDGTVRNDPATRLSLTQVDGENVPIDATIEDCAPRALGHGSCVTLSPRRPLAPNVAHVAGLVGLRDATGHTLAPSEVRFTTAASPDRQAPRLAELSCTPDAQRIAGAACLLSQDERATLTVLADEPARVSLRTAQAAVAAIGGHEPVRLRLDGLKPSSEAIAALTVVDAAGNRFEEAITIATSPALARISIDEVRSDPLGPEPQQEFVELLSSAAEATSIMGYAITTDPSAKGRRITTDLAVLPGERVLVVAERFDVADTRDGPLAPGLRIARLDGPLSLANGGHALVLRDRDGRRLDETPTLAAPEGACSARMPSGAFATATCTPGEETEWP